MPVHPYEHEHSGVMEISWSALGELLRQMAETINAGWKPDLVVGIAKGGVIPAAFISSALMLDFYPVKLSSRHNERIVSDEPAWHVYPTGAVKGKKVLLVDDICVAGRTFGKAVVELERLGATEVRTAAIAAHEDSVMPDYVAIVTDDLVVWPWDRYVFDGDGRWTLNPEYADGLKSLTRG